MSSNLPLPTYLGLNQEQKSEIPDYSQKLYNITDNTPALISHTNSIVVVNDTPINVFPTISLPKFPEIGSVVNIVQGKVNNLILSGNGKNILVNYIKYSTNLVTTASNSQILSTSGESFAPNTQCSFTVAYNGTEWQNLGACILVNIESLSEEETFTAARDYGMIQEAGKSPILLTFTYVDSLGNPYPGKTITLTSDKSGTIISPNSNITDGFGVATFNVSSSQLGATIFTAHFIDLSSQPAELNLTITFYTDNSTVISDSAVVPLGDPANITVTIKDTNNDLYSGKNVACLSSQPTDIVTTILDPTDGSGEAKFTIVADEVHVSTVSAQNTTDSYTISNTTSISFIDVPPIPILPTDSINLRYESDIGVYDFGTNEVILWEDQINTQYLNYENDTGRSRLILSGTTPSGQPSLMIPAGYYTYYRNYYGSTPGFSDRTICLVGKFPNSGYYKFCLGHSETDGAHIEGGTNGNTVDAYVVCSVYNPPETIQEMSYDNNWHVYLFTNATSTQTNFYKDNVFIGSRNTGIPTPYNEENSFIVPLTSVENGYVAALYSYSKVLSEEERTQLYNYTVYKFGV